MPASLETLPTELIDLIIVQLTLDLVPADSYFRRDMAYRQSVLENVSLVNRRLNSIVTPHQSFFICTSRQAERVRKFSKQRCEQVRTVVFYLDQPNGIVGSEAIDTLAALSQVKHARFYGFGEIKYYGPAGPDHDGETLYWHTHLDIDLSEASPFSGLDGLVFENCRLRIINQDRPSHFALTRLAFAGETGLLNDGVDKLFTRKTMPNLRTFRAEAFKLEHDSSPQGFNVPVIPADFLAPLDTSQIKPSHIHGDLALVLKTGHILIHTEETSWDYEADLAAALGARYLYLPKLPKRWSNELTMLCNMRHIQAVFLTRHLHPDRIHSKMRPRAELFLNAVKQMPADLIWTDWRLLHAFILPEFEQYLKAKKQDR